MTYTVRKNTDGRFVLVAENGHFARDTNCEFWMTSDRGKADEAAAYLNQDVGSGKRAGAHWLKSTFGVF